MNFVKTIFLKAGILIIYSMTGLIALKPDRNFLACILVLTILHYVASLVFSYSEFMSKVSYINTKARRHAVLGLLVALAILIPGSMLVMHYIGGMEGSWFWMALAAFVLGTVGRCIEREE